MLGLVALALAGAIAFGWFRYGPSLVSGMTGPWVSMSTFVLVLLSLRSCPDTWCVWVGMARLFIQSRSTVIQ